MPVEQVNFKIAGRDRRLLQFQFLKRDRPCLLIACRLRHTSPDKVEKGIYLPDWTDSITQSL